MSYLQPILISLRKYKYPEMRVYLDGADAPISCRVAVITNLPIYGFGLNFARSARADDGRLDVCLFQRHSAFQMFRYLYKVARGKHEQLSDVVCAQAQHVRIESDQPVPAQIDGDPAGETPIDIGIEPGACELFVPSDELTRSKGAR